MARTTGETIAHAYELHDKGMTQKQIAQELNNSNIPAYIRLMPLLTNGVMPPDKGSAYSLNACRDYIDNYMNRPAENDNDGLDIESFKVLRATFELGEIARRAIDGLLATLGVKL